jgi:hypothetical protein
MFNQLGEEFRNFRPEVPADLESKVMRAVNRDRRSFWKFSLLYLNVFHFLAAVGVGVMIYLYSISGEPLSCSASIASNSQVNQVLSLPAKAEIETANSESNLTGNFTKPSSKAKKSKFTANYVSSVSEVKETVNTETEVSNVTEKTSEIVIAEDMQSDPQDVVKQEIVQEEKKGAKPKGRKFTISTFHQ